MKINLITKEKFIITDCEDIYNYIINILITGTGSTYYTTESFEKEPDKKSELYLVLNSKLKNISKNDFNYKINIIKMYGDDIIETLESDILEFKDNIKHG